jgi:prepilin-type N-terminal cleavage/methylation domain-containing protein
VKKKGYTLIELLAVIFIIAATMSAWKSVSSSYGLWWGIGAGILAGALSILLVILFYYWMGRIEERILTKLRNKYTAIYRVKTVPSDPKIIILPEGAEIRVGDIGWHAGFHPDEIEKVAKKPSSQYDVECPYGADLSSLPACPFTVVERKTMTAGLPRNAIYVYENPAEYHPVTRSTDP